MKNKDRELDDILDQIADAESKLEIKRGKLNEINSKGSNFENSTIDG